MSGTRGVPVVRKLCAAAVASALSMSSLFHHFVAYAQTTPDKSCDLLDHRAAAGDIKAIFAQHPGRWVEVCKSAAGALDYAVLTAPAKDSLGVCHFSEQRVFDEVRNGVSSWVTVPSNVPRRAGLGEPVELMLRTTGACPDARSEAYVRTHDVSTQRFVEIARFFDRLSSSKERFARDFTGVDGANPKDLYFQRFQGRVLAKSLPLRSARLDYDLPSSSRKVYVLMFLDPEIGSVSYRVAIDFFSGHPVLRSFSASTA